MEESSIYNQNFSEKLQFGRGYIDSDKIDRISQMINNKTKYEQQINKLSDQDQQLFYLLEEKGVDLKYKEHSDLAIYILKRIVKKEVEIKYLQKIIEGIELFKQKPQLLEKQKITKKILNSIQLEFYEKDQTLFEIGDFGNTYYIVLKGNVNVLIPDPNTERTNKNYAYEKKSSITLNSASDKNQKQEQILKYDQNQKNKEDLQQEDFKDIEGNKKSIQYFLNGEFKGQDDLSVKIKQKYPNYACVKTYQPGESFGEIALLTNSHRTATCVAQSSCYLMTLTKTAFDNIMGAYKEMLIEENVKFLRGFSFLKDLPTQQLLSLCHLFKEHNLRPKSIIYSEKDLANQLYFVRQGQVELSRLQKVLQNESDKLDLKDYDKMKNQQNLNQIQFQKYIKNLYKRQPVVIYGDNSYFGYDEILNKQKKRQTQAVTFSNCLVYSIDKSTLVQIMRYYHTIKEFIIDIKLRSNWHKENQHRISEAKMQLMNYQYNTSKIQNARKENNLNKIEQNNNQMSQSSPVNSRYQKILEEQNQISYQTKFQIKLEQIKENNQNQNNKNIQENENLRFSQLGLNSDKNRNKSQSQYQYGIKKQQQFLDNYQQDLPSIQLLQKYAQKENLQNLYQQQFYPESYQNSCLDQTSNQESKIDIVKKEFGPSSSENINFNKQIDQIYSEEEQNNLLQESSQNKQLKLIHVNRKKAKSIQLQSKSKQNDEIKKKQENQIQLQAKSPLIKHDSNSYVQNEFLKIDNSNDNQMFQKQKGQLLRTQQIFQKKNISSQNFNQEKKYLAPLEINGLFQKQVNLDQKQKSIKRKQLKKINLNNLNKKKAIQYSHSVKNINNKENKQMVQIFQKTNNNDHQQINKLFNVDNLNKLQMCAQINDESTQNYSITERQHNLQNSVQNQQNQSINFSKSVKNLYIQKLNKCKVSNFQENDLQNIGQKKQIQPLNENKDFKNKDQNQIKNEENQTKKFKKFTILTKRSSQQIQNQVNSQKVELKFIVFLF
ncbi:Cyclic nucleotide-binding protein [Pseudocohnilembus persalinus]|uniref:Cyclic nucleotide-binding protein n=1 Tax=Pseudocohnilembus persalinus TaxID=266149 RepID=A0A0V0R4Q6_PSEPJ|nr:Cyclic nucleotide-binding protein [Pseudocohnilembus persalinus]|eukprot:KRX09454.1 Cyclic nucleotide-binding protein [Pseudocohnilembus persalinus]